MTVCAETADADAATEAVIAMNPDLLVIDVLLPGDAIGAMERITCDRPTTAIVVVTASRERDHFLESVRAGAAGYLLKDMDPDRLPNALRGVLAGEAAIPRPLVASLVTELRSRGQRKQLLGAAGRVELTSREWDVAELLAEGMQTAQMAERLGLSPVTVRRHISEVVRKLEVSDRAAVARVLTEQS